MASTDASTQPLRLSAELWLLLAVPLTVLPHAIHLPAWITARCLGLIGMRAWQLSRARGRVVLVHAAVAATEPTNGNPISDAARKSLADTLLPRFGDGYGQMLGRRFKDGVELSGGEWQKVALARSYMRQSQALILDEPTAALDARAEYEVFLRFSELVAGRMAIVISHRFSTVRMADRIIVLQHGEVVEEGSHVELVKRGGLYSELFELQAEGYR